MQRRAIKAGQITNLLEDRQLRSLLSWFNNWGNKRVAYIFIAPGAIAGPLIFLLLMLSQYDFSWSELWADNFSRLNPKKLVFLGVALLLFVWRRNEQWKKKAFDVFVMARKHDVTVEALTPLHPVSVYGRRRLAFLDRWQKKHARDRFGARGWAALVALVGVMAFTLILLLFQGSMGAFVQEFGETHVSIWIVVYAVLGGGAYWSGYLYYLNNEKDVINVLHLKRSSGEC